VGQPRGSSSDEIPLCIRCLTPHSPADYYCRKCGAAVGQWTTYLPYIDIPFLVNFCVRLWRRVWFEPGVSLPRRAFCLLLILFLVPGMLLGLPFVWAARRRNRRTDAA